MRGGSSRAFPVVLLAAAALACQQLARTAASAPFRQAVGDSDWELIELADQPAPTGAGGRRATIRFGPDTSRAGGFAGCNRYGGSYTVDGDALRFGALMMTKMACDQGMDLERRLAEALEATQRYELTGGRLTFYGASGPVARFARVAP
jgi:heat shock protein HslJ